MLPVINVIVVSSDLTTEQILVKFSFKRVVSVLKQFSVGCDRVGAGNDTAVH